jgi:hypothetical protein
VDVHHAVGEVVPIVADGVHAQTLRGRVRLGGRMIGTELWMLADDTGLAGDILVTFDFTLAAGVAGLNCFMSAII